MSTSARRGRLETAAVITYGVLYFAALGACKHALGPALDDQPWPVLPACETAALGIVLRDGPSRRRAALRWAVASWLGWTHGLTELWTIATAGPPPRVTPLWIAIVALVAGNVAAAALVALSPHVRAFLDEPLPAARDDGRGRCGLRSCVGARLVD